MAWRLVANARAASICLTGGHVVDPAREFAVFMEFLTILLGIKYRAVEF